MPLKVLVLGAGSIGRRHAGNLLQRGADVSITDPVPIPADVLREVARVPFDLDGLAEFDGVVVSSPSVHHLDHARAALDAGARVMVEKPLAISGAGLDDLVERAGDRLMVGYNLRLHEPVERFVDIVRSGRVGPVRSIRLWSGSYLPGWRPGVDYRSTYSAQASMGGGALLDFIHELDLLVWLVGDDVEVVGALVERLGLLEIDVEDTVRALLSARGVAIELSLDYLSRRYRRGVEAIGDDATVRLDWARSVLEIEDGSDLESWPVDVPIARSYEREADVFLTWLAGGPAPPVGAADGAVSVRLADEIRSRARRVQ